MDGEETPLDTAVVGSSHDPCGCLIGRCFIVVELLLADLYGRSPIALRDGEVERCGVDVVIDCWGGGVVADGLCEGTSRAAGECCCCRGAQQCRCRHVVECDADDDVLRSCCVVAATTAVAAAAMV